MDKEVRTTAAKVIGNVTERGFETQQAAINMLDQIAVQGLSHQNIRRQNAQVDAHLKQCLPDYVPPREEESEDGMPAHYTIISGNALIGSETTLQDLVDAADDCNKMHDKPVDETDKPQPKPEPKPQPQPQPQPKPDALSLLRKVPWFQLATLAGLAYGGWQLSRPQYVDVPARETTIDAEFLTEIEGRLNQ